MYHIKKGGSRGGNWVRPNTVANHCNSGFRYALFNERRPDRDFLKKKGARKQRVTKQTQAKKLPK